jgi:NAD+ synthase
MAEKFRIALAQLNPVVGDIEGNVARLREARRSAAGQGADLIITGELSVTGYPPEDLVLQPGFCRDVERWVKTLAADTHDGGPALLVGAPWRHEGSLYNAGLLLDEGEIVAERFKHNLPNYGVFDEARVFNQGPMAGPVAFRGLRLGIMLCEDMWFDEVSETLSESGAQILVVMNGSPYETDKENFRLNFAVARVQETGLPLIYVNQVGGQDELVFDGGSFVLDANNKLCVQAKRWEESVALSEWAVSDTGEWLCNRATIAEDVIGLEAVYSAMVVGLRDYVRKNGFPGVLVGMSGGVDSALSAAVAVDALGSSKVISIRMPSRFSSGHSLEDAEECAGLLGVECKTVPIGKAHESFEEMLVEPFSGHDPNVAEENIQARIRGLILMAISNKLGHMVLTTGNKSEMSVGYATLYGDMCGGFSVLKDVYKTKVYKLCEWRNDHWENRFLGSKGRVIPQSIIEKAPSAELRPDQTDQDSLPPYDQLDDILDGLVERELSNSEIVDRGHSDEVVKRIRGLLYLAEYKRRQGPPGVKITGKAFGRDRRYPITNGYLRVGQ